MDIPRSNPRRRRAPLALAVALGLVSPLLQPAFLWTRAWWMDRPAEPAPAPGAAADSSGFDPVPVAELWVAPADPRAAGEGLRAVLARARAERRAVVVAGARHSQGGQALARDGIQIDLSALRGVEIQPDRRSAWIGAGARWSEVLPALDAAGLSVAVMQSNHDFSVGGSLSVNAHGWQPGSPPLSSTVRALRILTADGRVRTASRTEETELFRHALGGYGLFGILLSAQLDVVTNRLVRPVRERVRAEEYPALYARRLRETPDAELAYGRLSVAPGAFLTEAILTRHLPVAGAPAPLRDEPGAPFRRAVYRAQIGSDAGKAWRWRMERWNGELGGDAPVARNQLLHEPSRVYRERNADRVDLLHEYFVPADGFAGFLAKARALIPGRTADLLNVTVREVRRDPDTALCYAPRDVFGLVLLFNLPRTAEARADMDDLADGLIRASLAHGGTYYLCYRPPRDPELFHRAYPRAREFLAAKRRWDPEGLFQNEWFRGLEPSAAPVVPR